MPGKVYYDPFLLRIYNGVPSFETVRVTSIGFKCDSFVYINIACVMREFPPSPPRHWAGFNQLSLTLQVGVVRSTDVRRVSMCEFPSDIRFLVHDDCIDVSIAGGVEAVVRADDVLVGDLRPYADGNPYR